MRRRAEPGMTRGGVATLAVVLALVVQLAARAASAGAQDAPASSELAHAYDLENAGRYADAARAYRAALAHPPRADALLGLERMYAELRASDSLLPLLDSLIANAPRDAMLRGMQLRTLQGLRREEPLRGAFERWARETPRDPTPYREYARALLALGRPTLADSIVERGRRVLGSGRALAFETAQLRAAQGQWVASALAWRVALADAPYLANAASFALTPTPLAARDSVRDLLGRDAALAARQALAGLELGWGRAAEAWEALRTVTPDTAAATAWAEFGERAMTEERYAQAYAALSAAAAIRPTAEVKLAAARAALRAGAPRHVLELVPMPPDGGDTALVRDYLPLQVAALGALGRAADAAALLARHEATLSPGLRERLSRDVAFAFARAGDLARARSALGTGPEADSSDAAGWLALYDGRIRDAGRLLRTAREPGADLALALGLLARVHEPRDVELGGAFLALARGDSATAAAKFADAAPRHADAGPALLLAAARLRAESGDVDAAAVLWSRLVSTMPDAPESTEAELDWARALRHRGDRAGAIAHLEHLILAAPRSALLPQARRELDLARAIIP